MPLSHGKWNHVTWAPTVWRQPEIRSTTAPMVTWTLDGKRICFLSHNVWASLQPQFSLSKGQKSVPSKIIRGDENTSTHSIKTCFNPTVILKNIYGGEKSWTVLLWSQQTLAHGSPPRWPHTESCKDIQFPSPYLLDMLNKCRTESLEQCQHGTWKSMGVWGSAERKVTGGTMNKCLSSLEWNWSQVILSDCTA